MYRLLIASALLGSVANMPARADNRVTISYDRTSLATADGRRALERRVARAVVRVCGDVRVTGSLVANPAVRKCRVEAAAAVRPQIERAVAQALRPAEVASIDKGR